MLNLLGTIVAQGRFIPSGKVVRLDEPHLGRKYAIINEDTADRIEFYNRLGNNELVGSRVVIVDATVGPEALLATKIKHPD